MAPRVTVVIPCFNLGAYLDEALDSLEAQTLAPLEVIVVDDGSTDPLTQDVLRRCQRPRTRVISTANQGVGAARNTGARAAGGDYLCFLDADDRLGPGYLEKTTAALEANPALGFASSWLRTFGQEQWDWRASACDLEALLFGNIGAATVVVRRPAFEAVGGYDTRMPHQGYEDWDLLLALTTRGLGGVLVPEILYFYRVRPGSMAAACCTGQQHTDLMHYLYRKYEAAYGRHFLSVAAKKLAQELGPMLGAARRRGQVAQALGVMAREGARARVKLRALLLLDQAREALRKASTLGAERQE